MIKNQWITILKKTIEQKMQRNYKPYKTSHFNQWLAVIYLEKDIKLLINVILYIDMY